MIISGCATPEGISGSGGYGYVNLTSTVLQDIHVSDVHVRRVRYNHIDNPYYHQPCAGRLYFDTVEISGGINRDTSFIVGKMLQDISEEMTCSPRRDTPPTEVFMNSGGGLLYDGFAIGEQIRWHRADTYVIGQQFCASSCAVAFLGGVDRAMVLGGQLLFHAPYYYEQNSTTNQIRINCTDNATNNDLKRYYQQMLGEQNGGRLFERTMQYCSTDDGWMMNEQAALLYGITTRSID